MATRNTQTIGRAELEILRYISDHHPVSVRDVSDNCAQAKGQARTTVLNVMERLRRKGHLTRSQQDGVYCYSPTVPKPQLLTGLVGDFMERVLGGSLQPFVAYLSQEARVSDHELQQLKQLVKSLDEGRELPSTTTPVGPGEGPQP